MSIDFSKIKLVIWDLDETFWDGILSEHSARFNEANAKLIRDMTDAGVISSICSKNDPADVQDMMEQHGIWNLFVFNSVNWSPKGARVKQIVSSMNLRAPNVLFVDDNETNLGEVRAACAGIMTSNADIIPDLQKYFADIEKKDPRRKRLLQYKVLEQKQNFKAEVGSNEGFLQQCKIHVEIRYYCESHIDRIVDLLQRANQLNFTKVRSTKSELEELLKDPAVKAGYVTVSDRFGDYGLVGFYAMREDSLLHFVFSCRTLNMGVEQYVYHELGCPKITIAGDVSSSLDTGKPDWINRSQKNETHEHRTKLRGKKILVKGPCDMQQIFTFIKETKAIKTEFVYVNNYGVSIEQGCHTTSIVESRTLDKNVMQRLVKSLPFGDKGMFKTDIFNGGVGYVILSMLTDPNLGLYREKKSGAIVPFGEYTNDLTDESLWPAFMEQTLFTANCKFSPTQLQDIKRDFEFIGRIEPADSVKNLEFIYKHLAPQAKLLLCLGSETPYESNQKAAYADRHIYHRELNRLIREWASDKPTVYLLDTNELIEGQQDFTTNINHFTKEIYFKLSQEIISIINQDMTGNSGLMLATESDQKRSELIRKVKRIPNVLARRFHGSH